MAKKSKTKEWIEYTAVRGILGVLGAMPRGMAVRTATAVAAGGYHLLGGLRRVAATNLEIAFPEMPAADRVRMIKGSFRNLGRVLGEMSQFKKLTREDLSRLIEFRIDPEVYEQYQQLKREGRGVIIVSPHLGNWEMLVFGWAAFEGPMHYLARPLDNPGVEKITSDLRTRFGNRPINKTNAVMAAARVLREHGLLGILADVNAHPKEGVFVPFFGVPACTSTGVALLAIRTRSAIVPMCGVWDEGLQRYLAIHGPMIFPTSTGDRSRDVLETTAAFTAEVEKLIRQYPDQWLWIHKRWKTRPPGEPKIY